MKKEWHPKEKDDNNKSAGKDKMVKKEIILSSA